MIFDKPARSAVVNAGGGPGGAESPPPLQARINRMYKKGIDNLAEKNAFLIPPLLQICIVINAPLPPVSEAILFRLLR